MNRWFDNIPWISKYLPGKIILSLLMVILALVLYLCVGTWDRALCAFAMGFSFIGDTTMNHNKDHSKQTKKEFYIGGTAFILAHIAYFLAYGFKILANQLKFFNFGVVVVVFILIMLTIYITIKAKETRGTKMFYFCLAYLWLTGINYCTIFSYSYSCGNPAMYAFVGALLFLASDVIIGMEKLLGLKSEVAREAVWWLYPLGQIILIICA